MRPRRSILVLLVGMLATTACAGDTTPSEAAAPVAEQSSDEQLSDEQSSDERQADANGGPHVTKRHPSDRTHIRPDRDRTRPTVAAGDASDEIAELTESDTSGLLWMREEEQLAHDVYTALGERWGLRIFENIAASERTHIEFVVALLDRYGVDDSLAGVSTGQFTIPEMQELYDELVAVGQRVDDRRARGRRPDRGARHRRSPGAGHRHHRHPDDVRPARARLTEPSAGVHVAARGPRRDPRTDAARRSGL